MDVIERERVADANPGLDQVAFEKAWQAFQNQPIDMLADSDDTQCRCLGAAIKAYLLSIGRY